MLYIFKREIEERRTAHRHRLSGSARPPRAAISRGARVGDLLYLAARGTRGPAAAPGAGRPRPPLPQMRSPSTRGY